MANSNSKQIGLKGYTWLFTAVLCIVFSSASKKLIELKVTPANYSSSHVFSKKIKDGSRDKRQYLNAIIHTDNQQSPDNNFSVLFFLSSFITLALLYIYTGNLHQVILIQQPVISGGRRLYLRHSRLQV